MKSIDQKRIERLLRLNSIEKQNVTDRDLKLEAIHDHVVSDESNKIKLYKIRKILEDEIE